MLRAVLASAFLPAFALLGVVCLAVGLWQLQVESSVVLAVNGGIILLLCAHGWRGVRAARGAKRCGEAGG
ncbi:MAG TPA: hypothetical protein VGC35_02790 [Allosphingosinicella sp.]|jgi:hypothetical protein